MSSNSWNLSVINEIQWVAGSGVFSDGSIKIVDFSGGWIHSDIFQDSTELDGVINLWLFFSTKIDALGVTSTFNVEYSGFSPDVFIVTNELSVTDR